MSTTTQQGGDKYQQAFYVFEELAQAPATSSVRSLVSQAVAEIHLGRTEEAQAALDQALKKEPGFADAIANQLVWSVITGQDSAEHKAYVTNLHIWLWFSLPLFWYLRVLIYMSALQCARAG